ncbi:MAG: tetratricopeptide repeat protein [Saprospiraceae bacterium]
MAKKTAIVSAQNKSITKNSSEISNPIIWWQNTRIMGICIAVLVFILYANTLRHEYTLDDPIVITENMYTTKGLAGIKDIWTHDSFFGYFKEESKAQLVAGGRYRPLSATMFAAGWQLFGNNPFWGHFFNILWYAVTCIVLYVLLLRLFKNNSERFMIAALTTVLFAVHPLHSEVIANVKGRDEIMSLLLSLAALWYSLKAFDFSDQEKKSNIIACVLFFLAMTAKENAIMFIFIVPLVYYFFSDASSSKIISQSVYFVLPAILFLLIRGSIIGWKFQTTQAELMNNPFIKWDGAKYILFDNAEKLATVIYTLGKYIILLFAPLQLTHDYYPRQVAIMNFGNWEVWLSLFTYLGLAFASYRSLSTKNPIGFAILYFGLTLAIVSNLFFPIGTNMGERFVFMPSVGFCLALVLLLTPYFKNQWKTGILAAFTLICLIFSYKTISRNNAWKDNFTLLKTDIQVSQNSAKLRNALGGELIAQAQKEKNPQVQAAMFDEAMVHLQKATEIHPNYQNAYLLLGNAYNYKKNFEKAIEKYNKCLQIEPGNADATHNLAITYRYYGTYFLQEKKDVPNAVRCLEEMYRLQPDDIEAIRMMGKASGLKGDHQKAVEYFTAVITKNPKDAEAYNDLSIAYGLLGNPAKAAEMKQKAVQLNPKSGG